MPSTDRRPMLEAESVAVIGASDRRGSVGNQTIRQLIAGGVSGRVIPVNPRHDQIEGITCVSIEESGPVDLAVLAVGHGR